jgi:hypothetical protein
MSTWFNYTATLKVLVFGLLVGAALPALFAFGVRLGTAGAGISGDAITRRRWRCCLAGSPTTRSTRWPAN